MTPPSHTPFPSTVIDPRLVLRLLAGSILLYCLAFSVGPLLDGGMRGSSPSAVIFSQLCHQDPARSFSWFGTSWTVCHRCSAIYLSFFFTSLLLLIRAERIGKTSTRSIPGTPGASLFFALLAPMFLDVAANTLGIWQAGMVSRFLTGSLAGVALGWMTIPLLVEAVLDLRKKAGDHRSISRA